MIHFRPVARGCALAAALAVAPVAVQALNFINVLTGGPSGVYCPLGAGLANIYGEKIDGVRTQVQSTKASAENLNLLPDGQGELAFALGDAVAAAWDGNVDAGFPPKLDKLCGIAAIYPNYIQVVASQDSGIADFEGLKDKSMSVGACLGHRVERAGDLWRDGHVL